MDAASLLIESFTSPGMVFAVLSDSLSDDHKFVETVALNRGKNVRLFFGSEDEAIEWLMKQAT